MLGSQLLLIFEQFLRYLHNAQSQHHEIIKQRAEEIKYETACLFLGIAFIAQKLGYIYFLFVIDS